MRRSKYDAAMLAPIVASSQSLADVMRKIGITPNGGNHRHISRLVREYGLDTSHFHAGTRRAAIEAVAPDELATMVADSSSMAQVLTRLNLPTEGRAHHELKRRLDQLAIATSHFKGQGWSRGETTSSHASLARGAARRASSPEEVFVENGRTTRRARMIQWLLDMGWSHTCAICGVADWCSKPLVLHLDHINGVHTDNRRVNLRLLCPNCHSQTPTYCRRPVKPSGACEPRARYTCYTSARQRACWNW